MGYFPISQWEISHLNFNVKIGMNPNMESIAERLEFYMDAKGFNRTSLAKSAGVNVTMIRDIIERGTGRGFFVAICTA